MTAPLRPDVRARTGAGQDQRLPEGRRTAWTTGTTTSPPPTRRSRSTRTCRAYPASDFSVELLRDRSTRRRSPSTAATSPSRRHGCSPARPGTAGESGSRSRSTFRSPAAWAAARRMPRPACSPATRSGAPRRPRDELLAHGREARRRRAVRARRRHGDRHRQGRPAQPGAGEGHLPLGARPRRVRHVDARRVPRARRATANATPRTSSRPRRSPPSTPSVLQALRAGDARQLAEALHNDLQAAALHLAPGLGHDPRTRGGRWAPSPASSPGPARPWRSSPRMPTRRSSSRSRSAPRGSTSVRATGPVHGARLLTD